METLFLVSPIEKMDVRDSSANHDNTWTMSGYAAVFGHTATLFDSKFERVTVSIAPEAFANVMSTQGFDSPEGVVHFNNGHDMNTAVAATNVPAGQPGSLELSVDKSGLRFLARVARDDPDAIALASKMRTGVVRQASFAFTSENEFTYTENEDGPDEVHRLITDVTHLYDVCATTQGVFRQTVSGLQTYAKLLGQPSFEGGRHRQPDLGGETFVNPETEGEEEVPAERSILIDTREALAAIRSATWHGGMVR